MQQPIAARICFPGLCCPVIGLLWQQHFSLQPELASTPVANKLAPKVRVNAMQIAFKMSNLVGGASFFIVKQYTLGNFAMSTDLIINLYKAGVRIYISDTFK